MTPDRHLVVFARKPELGRVKTRLAAEIGNRRALEFYRRNLSGLLARMAAGDWRCWISLSPDEAVTEPPFWPGAFAAVGQGGGDLGWRMGRAIDTLPPGPVALIGADIPAIRPGHVESALLALRDHDAVFGPAVDGGYWLVGGNRSFATADMFENVRWSTRHALADTLANLTALGKSAALLETLEDIDDGKAYEKWLSNTPSG